MSWGGKWTKEADAELRSLWRSGMKRPLIAWTMDRSVDSITKRARRIGLESRMRKGAGDAEPIGAKRQRDAFAPRDDEYVAAVDALGGFPACRDPTPSRPMFFDGERFRRAYG